MQENEGRRCNCQRSKCLKLYCDCYSSGKYCIGCSCENCHNIPAFEEERKAAWSRIEAKNQSGILRGLPSVLVQEGTVGCNCTKSQCQQKYCYCFKKGLRCSPACKCHNCKNPLGGDNREAVVAVDAEKATRRVSTTKKKLARLAVHRSQQSTIHQTPKTGGAFGIDPISVSVPGSGSGSGAISNAEQPQTNPS